MGFIKIDIDRFDKEGNSIKATNNTWGTYMERSFKQEKNIFWSLGEEGWGSEQANEINR